jgi:hypothetical protein
MWGRLFPPGLPRSRRSRWASLSFMTICVDHIGIGSETNETLDCARIWTIFPFTGGAPHNATAAEMALTG